MGRQLRLDPAQHAPEQVQEGFFFFFLFKCCLFFYSHFVFLPSFMNLSWLNYIGHVLTFLCDLFLFLVNTALILKVKTKNVNITKGVSLFSFSRNFSFL